LARVNPRLTGEKFAQGAEIFKHSSTKSTKGIFG
jgi:hypothetical protein